MTYHGPGQLVGYPIMGVGDVIEFLRTLESALITALADEGVEAEVRDGLTGVWVGERKIGSIGLHVSRGVTMHGFAVNVDCDLQPFEWIVPCGIADAGVTSLSAELGRPVSVIDVLPLMMAELEAADLPGHTAEPRQREQATA